MGIRMGKEAPYVRVLNLKERASEAAFPHTPTPYPPAFPTICFPLPDRSAESPYIPADSPVPGNERQYAWIRLSG